jgi:hypothetical protein
MSTDAPGLPAEPGTSDVDALLARYAPRGRELRRRRRRGRIGLGVLGVTVALTLLAGWQSRDELAARMAPDAGAMAQALARATAENAALVRRLDDMTRERDELAAREAGLRQRQAELDGRLDKAEADRRALVARSGDGPGLDRERAEIARQRDALEQQRRLFVTQGQAVSRELGEIRAQRAEIERQRQAIEVQQAEVRRLLDHAREVGAARGQPPAGAEPGPDAPGSLQRMAAVDDGTLGEVRGGVDLGGDYNIAIGITRSTSINGFEQFTSTMQIDNLATLAATGLPSTAFDSVVIQVGAANVAGTSTLESISPAVTTLIQNTLDNQNIANRTQMDISLQNVGTVTQGLQISRAVGESLALRP